MPRDRDADLPASLLDAVLARLDLPRGLVPDLAGLRAVYGAWCRSTPFDNVRKLIALATDAPGPLPGIDAADFFDAWLTHGAGGTCWPSSNALHALLAALGFDARRVAGSMHDVGAPNHGSVKVRVDGEDWLVDSSMLTYAPLPLDRGIVAYDDGVVAAEVEPLADTHRLWVHAPPNERHVPCRIFGPEVDHGFYAGRYAASRESSPFNQRVYARRGGPDAMTVLAGATWYRKTREGLERRDLNPDEIVACLRSEFRLSSEIVDRWMRCGGVEAALTPATGPKPPRTAELPPSLRERPG